MGINRTIFGILVGIGLVFLLASSRNVPGRRAVEGYPDFGSMAAANWGQGEFANLGSQNKFGFNSDVDNAEETIYEGNDNSGPARAILDTSAFSLYISSNNGADTEANNVDMVVEGLDASWDEQSITVTAAGNGDGGGALNGITFVRVGAASSWMRVNRAYNSGSAPITGTIYLHSDAVDANADGVPDDPTNELRTVVSPGEDQTLQAVYTIPRNYIGLLYSWCTSALAGGGSDNITIRLRRHPNGGVGRVQVRAAVSNPGTECIEYNPPVKFDGQSAIEATAISTGAASNVDVGSKFDLTLVPDYL